MHHSVNRLALAIAFCSITASSARGQLFENLDAFGKRLDVGDPDIQSTWRAFHEGPKGIASGDLDGDGTPDLAASNLDGTVTVYLNRGDRKFSDPVHLGSGVKSLRGIAVEDLNGDGKDDIATAALLDQAVVIFLSRGNGAFDDPIRLPGWLFVRNLAAGDFDGDGSIEIAAAGPGLGLRIYKKGPDGSFSAIQDLPELSSPPDSSTKPVFSLRALRPSGANYDVLVATHAYSSVVWILGANGQGGLAIKGSVAGFAGIYSLDVGPIAHSASSGKNDLVTAHPDQGFLEVRQAGAGVEWFQATVSQRIAIPGAPRAVRIADMDRDGWNDVVVTLKHLNAVLVYRNNLGTLEPATELPVGQSPRDLVTADFNGDGQPDVAVINRISSDVSVLYGHPGQAGFGVLDQIYLVDGEVSDLAVADLNRDGRDDVLQLHRASSDFSVRLAMASGSLAEPAFYPVGPVPNAFRIRDVDGDGNLDVVTANLGRDGIDPGTVSIRLGDGQGGFHSEKRAELPAVSTGRLFAIEVADFDGDGLLDIAAGFFDCRLAFFKGKGSGDFEYTQQHYFTGEARAMISGDFDGDGDIDLAGAGYQGDVVVVENTGDLLTTTELARVDYPSPTSGKFGTRDMRSKDLNGDGDLDIVLASGSGVMVYMGGAGMSFVLVSQSLPGTDYPTSSVGVADFDGDHSPDIAVACKVLSCVTILTQDAGGEFLPAVSVDVPAAQFIATGDLDGDGFPDLVGSGDALWTALSSRKAQRSGPPKLEGRRPVASGPVINEILAINNELPLDQDGGRKSDWVEVFNAADHLQSLAGWRMRLDAEGVTHEYTFPASTQLASKGFQLIVCETVPRTPFHAGFKLPGDGGTLTLIDAQGVEVDRMVYPVQRDNVSYSRYRDGIASFTFNSFPSPAISNPDNGSISADFKLDGIRPYSGNEAGPLGVIRPNRPIRFEARGKDDVGIVSASIVYQRTDVPDAPIDRIILFDDGMHGDGEMQDGSFVGVLADGLPALGEIRFQVEVEDLSGNVTTLPDLDEAPVDPIADDGGTETFFAMSVGASFPGIQISEIVAVNTIGLKDETGGFPDWVEVRNCGATPVSLDGIRLSEHFPDVSNSFAFPSQAILQPGGYFVVFCDGNIAQGKLHAPFSLKGEGGKLFLVGTTARGSSQIIDAVELGPQKPDLALARSGCGGSWLEAVPTPGAENVPGLVATGDVNADGFVNISDPIALLGFLFQGTSIGCIEAADSNGDKAVDLSDAIHILVFLFGGGPSPTGATKCSRS